MNETLLCWVCSKPLPASDGPGRPRRYCDLACKADAKKAQRATRRREWNAKQLAAWSRERDAFRAEHLGDAA